jgi:hypothetical protein
VDTGYADGKEQPYSATICPQSSTVSHFPEKCRTTGTEAMHCVSKQSMEPGTLLGYQHVRHLRWEEQV